MAGLFDGVVIENRVYRGAGRVVWAPKGTPFPISISDVINLTTYALVAPWADLGGTTKDGITIVRGLDKLDPVMPDQLPAGILRNQPVNWRGTVAFSLLHTDLDTLKQILEGGSITSGTGERYLDLGTPETLTEILLAVIQKHSKTGKHRMFAFRRCTLAGEDIEMAIQSEEATALPVTFDLEPDLSISDLKANLYRIFEEV